MLVNVSVLRNSYFCVKMNEMVRDEEAGFLIFFLAPASGKLICQGK